MVDASTAVFVAASLSGYSTGLEVMESLLQADRVINVPVVKHHSLSRTTLGMKNWMGVLGRGRNRLHQSIHRAVAELGAMFRPTLTVMDATRILLSNGPQGGSLADVKAVGAVAVGTDPLACEVWGAALMGLQPASLAFITEAAQRGLGRADLSLVKELGHRMRQGPGPVAVPVARRLGPWPARSGVGLALRVERATPPGEERTAPGLEGYRDRERGPHSSQSDLTPTDRFDSASAPTPRNFPFCGAVTPPLPTPLPPGAGPQPSPLAPPPGSRGTVMRWMQRIRVLYQGFFLVLFLWLLAGLAAGDLRDLPFSVFHHADPLSAVGVVLAAGTLPGALVWATLLIGLTLVFGRVFCGWICPLGTLQHLASWLFAGRKRRESRELNRYRRWYGLKTYILVAVLVGALLGTLQSGWLDPLSLAARGLASGLWAALPGGKPVPGGWLAAVLLLAILVASRFVPRLFCRALCPLGALLGVFARFSVLRISRRQSACTDCGACSFACQGADEPLGTHRVHECHVCLNCVPACEGAQTGTRTHLHRRL